MSKIIKLMMMVMMVGTLVVMSTGCGGGGGDDDTIANVAGVWEVTIDGRSDSITLVQDGHNLTLMGLEFGDVSGDIYGRDVTFEFTATENGETASLLIEVTLDSVESPSIMTGTLKGIIDGVVIETMPITFLKE